MTAEPTTEPGYGAHKGELGERLRKIEGQVRGVERMIDNDRYCIDVLTQISAIQAALDQVALGLLDDHVHVCLSAEPERRDERTDELMAAVRRLLGRS